PPQPPDRAAAQPPFSTSAAQPPHGAPPQPPFSTAAAHPPHGAPLQPPLPLYCPPGVLDRLAGLEPDVDLAAVFDLHPLPGRYQVGPFALTGVPLPHFVPTAGIRLVSGPTALAYTGDTGPGPAL